MTTKTKDSLQSLPKDKVATLPAWKVILRMIRYRPWLWLGNLGSLLALILSFQVPGLVQRAFFDLLTGGAQVSFGLWSLVALLFASEVGRALSSFGIFSTNVPFFVHTMTLLRKNLLVNILRRPGASA